jgi:hypothetical protein
MFSLQMMSLSKPQKKESMDVRSGLHGAHEISSALLIY